MLRTYKQSDLGEECLVALHLLLQACACIEERLLRLTTTRLDDEFWNGQEWMLDRIGCYFDVLILPHLRLQGVAEGMICSRQLEDDSSLLLLENVDLHRSA